MKHLLSFALAAALLMSTSTVYACGSDKKASLKKASAEQSVEVVEANVTTDDNGVKQYTCPVSGKTETVSATTKYVDYDGRRYYVNCDGCKTSFTANPAKYTTAARNFDAAGKDAYHPGGEKASKASDAQHSESTKKSF